jgi:hypothetical protein
MECKACSTHENHETYVECYSRESPLKSCYRWVDCVKMDLKFGVRVHVAPGRIQLQAFVNRVMNFMLHKKQITFN